MHKALRRLADKAIDKGYDYVLTIMVAGAMWLLYSPLWGGWRAVAIGVSVAIAVFCVVRIYRRVSARVVDNGRDDTSPEERDFFVGQWECGHGDPKLDTFILTLNEDGTVRKSHVPGVSGTWVHSGGAARINTSDHWRDTLRRTPEGVVKFAYDETSGALPDSMPSNSSLAKKQPSPP